MTAANDPVAHQLRLFAHGKKVDAGAVTTKVTGSLGDRINSTPHEPGDPVYLLVATTLDAATFKRVDGVLTLVETYKAVAGVEVDDSWGAAKLAQLTAHQDAEADEAMRDRMRKAGIEPIMPGEYPDPDPDDEDPDR